MFKTLCFLALTSTQVAAHGSILTPTVVFQDPYNKNAPSVLVPGTPGPYTGNAVLKELADSKGSTCGKTNGNAAPQPIPSDGVVQVQFSAAHIGPCEVWLDNEKVASAKECVKQFPDGKIKVDFSKCASAQCQLRWVWLATHNDPWEIFDNCVNVKGSGGSTGSTPIVSPSPVVTTSAPTPTTSTPATTKPAANSQKPTPTTKPTATTAAPAPGTKTYKGIDGSAALNWWCTINCERGYCPASTCIEA